ncbi:hypothetical protein ACP70R_041522 [Stipagrostis hirtigluma subsp. patula]
MSKRPAADFDDDGSAGKRPRETGRKKHLYLVLDDWNTGYSIHKVDVGVLCSGAGPGPGPDAPAGPLPEPPALRLQVSGDHRSTSFAAMGTKIVIVHALYDDDPRSSAALQYGFRAAVCIAGRLYALLRHHPWEVMSRAPHRPHADDDHRWRRRVEEWLWSTVASPPPFPSGAFIAGYAVHPNGRTIFVSAERRAVQNDPGTYSFDTESCRWKRHGDWMLPLHGEGLYDGDLDAWVGLSDDGFPCACDIPSCDGASSLAPAPDWREGKDMVFHKTPNLAAEVALVRMDNGEFCVVEVRPPEGVDVFAVGDDMRRVLRVSVFRLRYNMAGELRTRGLRRVASYLVTKSDRLFFAEAFWM